MDTIIFKHNSLPRPGSSELDQLLQQIPGIDDAAGAGGVDGSTVEIPVEFT